MITYENEKTKHKDKGLLVACSHCEPECMEHEQKPGCWVTIKSYTELPLLRSGGITAFKVMGTLRPWKAIKIVGGREREKTIS